MAQDTTTPAKNSQPADKPLPILPEEKFWQHYSPHHEAPLSGVTSLGLHILVVALVLLAGYYLTKTGYAKDRPPPVTQVTVPDLDSLPAGPNEPPRGGGGGSPTGSGSNAGENAEEDVGPPSTGDAKTDPPDQVPLPKTDGPATDIKLPRLDDDPALKDLIKESNDAAKSVKRLSDDVQEKLRNGLRKGAGKGGSGSGGGRGSGDGTGEGSGSGPGVGSSTRERRVLRWKLIFSTYSGEDYAKQLAGLGAILAIPDSEDPNQFRVFHDLHQRPAVGRIEDIGQITRIFWIDDRPPSVASLAQALRISPVPPRVVAFFPESLEKKLVELEKHASGGKREEEIGSTQFEVVPNGTGGYKVRVVGVQPLGPGRR